MMHTRRRMLGRFYLSSVLWLVCINMAVASSIPPENKLTGIHHLHMKGNSPALAVPFEDVDNSIQAPLGGREVDPRPSILPQKNSKTSTVTTESPGSHNQQPPSSVKKQLDDKLALSADKEAAYLTPDEAVDSADEEQHQLLEAKEDAMTGKEDVSNSKIQQDGLYGKGDSDLDTHQNSIVARKGVPDPVPVVSVSQQLKWNDSNGLEDEIKPSVPLSMQPVQMATDPSVVATTKVSFSTTVFGSADSLRPFNDIPKPVDKPATTEKPKPVFEPSPVSLLSSTTPTNDTMKSNGTSHTKPPVKHYKPLVAVDSMSNKSFNSTPVIIGVVFGVVVILAVSILAYKRLQDVWSRRHYDRMDFLIDGMYDL